MIKIQQTPTTILNIINNKTKVKNLINNKISIKQEAQIKKWMFKNKITTIKQNKIIKQVITICYNIQIYKMILNLRKIKM